ncbi:hypothetical protein CAAN1_24S00738 [[Candida] anglica]|uniref:Zn(2)-C6 fungal-type domain-containing protein n=1 Tax=[Candida] anglica TaxID=148631 RepID=A0ABP0EH93_9ASCO
MPKKIKNSAPSTRASSKSSRPYKSRTQRPCDFCRRRKTCCVIEGTIPCTPCLQFNKGLCTFNEGPMKRNNKQDKSVNQNTTAVHKTEPKTANSTSGRSVVPQKISTPLPTREISPRTEVPIQPAAILKSQANLFQQIQGNSDRNLYSNSKDVIPQGPNEGPSYNPGIHPPPLLANQAVASGNVTTTSANSTGISRNNPPVPQLPTQSFIEVNMTYTNEPVLELNPQLSSFLGVSSEAVEYFSKSSSSPTTTSNSTSSKPVNYYNSVSSDNIYNIPSGYQDEPSTSSSEYSNNTFSPQRLESLTSVDTYSLQNYEMSSLFNQPPIDVREQFGGDDILKLPQDPLFEEQYPIFSFSPENDVF